MALLSTHHIFLYADVCVCVCVCVCVYFYITFSCVALFMCHVGSVCSCLKDFCLLLICACFCSFVYIHFQLVTPTLCPVLLCLSHVKQRWWFVSFMWLFFYPFFRPHSIQMLWQIQSILQSCALTCLAAAKIAFLLCRSEGFCCDKSDRLTEQLSGLLTVCMSFDKATGWFVDSWMTG